MDLNIYIGLEYTELTCWGLVRKIYSDIFDIELPPVEELIESEVLRNCTLVGTGYEEFGDIVVFKEAIGKHVGLVVVPGKMIHAIHSRTSAIESYRGLRWKDKIQNIYRHNESV